MQQCPINDKYLFVGFGYTFRLCINELSNLLTPVYDIVNKLIFIFIR